jgi:hypothetical protein
MALSLQSCQESSNSNYDVEAQNPLRITSVSPDFGDEGATIEVMGSGFAEGTIPLIANQEIEPTVVEPDRIEFTLPAGLSTGPLKVRLDGRDSNSLMFYITNSGLMEPNKDADFIQDELGNKVVSSYVVVAMHDANDNVAEASRVAGLVSGIVIGRLGIINGWQVSITADTMDALEAIADLLESDPAVDFVVIDFEVLPEEVNWDADPAKGGQRDRNNIEQGVDLYAERVGINQDGKVYPSFMAIGVSETGVDYDLPDFSGYAEDGTASSGSVSIYAAQKDTGSTSNDHGSNVAGIIAAELGDAGNAGPIRALSGYHGGANINVSNGSTTILSRLEHSDRQIKAGAQLINWSWGIHRQGATTCESDAVDNNIFTDRQFNDAATAVRAFFKTIETDHPRVLVVTSAGNGHTDAGDPANRVPSSIESDQLIVVGAHTVGAEYSNDEEVESDDEVSAKICAPDELAENTPIRAWYSNYGERVDITASGAIVGIDNSTVVNDSQGTSYSTPLVASAVALLQSINPNLSPAEIKAILRSSALPIENRVIVTDADDSVVTRALAEEENPDHAGEGARLNLVGAIEAAIDSLEEQELPLADPVVVEVTNFLSDVTETVTITLPEEGVFYNEVDILFLVDVSGSYGDDLSTFRSTTNDLINGFSSFGANVEIALASFQDFPQIPYGSSVDYPYRLDQELTDNYDDVISALNNLSADGGGDEPESQLEAMYQASQADTGWREGALPIIFLATDASFHDSDNEEGYPGAGFSETVSALNSRDIKIFGLQSGGSIDDVNSIVDQTDGAAFTLSRDSAEIIAVVEEAYGEASNDISVSLEPLGDFGGFVKSITPAGIPDAEDGDPIENVSPGDTVQFDVVFSKGFFDDDATHTFSFRLRLLAEGVATILDVPVTLTLN